LLSNNPSRARYTLGFNFDDRLVEALIALPRTPRAGPITEVFGALADSPMSSARPTVGIPQASSRTLATQASKLRTHGIEFNYLMNTSEPVGPKRREVLDYLYGLANDGITRVTVGTTALARLIKRHLPDFHVTMSITKGVRTVKELQRVERSGCDACYLDGVFVNRNIELLVRLIDASSVQARLYANMSCVSACPVVRQHYNAFARQTPETATLHDGFFAGCSLIKLLSPVEWIQMPWIRPEDIETYAALGIDMFKLSDRLAPTPVLTRIAQTYTSGTSPNDLFDIIERSGAKYRKLLGSGRVPAGGPYTVDAKLLPRAFVEHFFDGRCISQDKSCAICAEAAARAVRRRPDWDGFLPSEDVLATIPAPLASRAVRAARLSRT
jgi:hypothetical protein